MDPTTFLELAKTFGPYGAFSAVLLYFYKQVTERAEKREDRFAEVVIANTKALEGLTVTIRERREQTDRLLKDVGEVKHDTANILEHVAPWRGKL